MTTGQETTRAGPANTEAFETRDFYLACFLRCSGYALLDLRPKGRRKIFVFKDSPERQADVLSFYGDNTTQTV